MLEANILILRPQDCNMCGEAVAGSVEIRGSRVCDDCLRRLDADPAIKRRIMLGAGTW